MTSHNDLRIGEIRVDPEMLPMSGGATIKMGPNCYVGVSIMGDVDSNTVTVTIARAHMPAAGPPPDSWPTVEVEQIEDTLVSIGEAALKARPTSTS